MAKRKLLKRKYAQGIKRNSEAVLRKMKQFAMGPRAVRRAWKEKYGDVLGIRWNMLHDGRKMRFIEWMARQPQETEQGEE